MGINLKKARFFFAVLCLAVLFCAVFWNIYKEEWIKLLKLVLYAGLGLVLSPIIDLIKWRWNYIFREKE